LKKFLYGCFIVAALVIAAALLAAWFFGLPYLAALWVGGSYFMWLSAWFFIYFVGNLIMRVKLYRQLKKYETIHQILKTHKGE
jgi:membrane protein implicated in regulation of membrane protease activity